MKISRILMVCFVGALVAMSLRGQEPVPSTTAIESALAMYDFDYLAKSIKNDSNGIVCAAWVVTEIKIDLQKRSAVFYIRGAVTAEDANKGIYTNEIKTSTLNDIDITKLASFLALYTECAIKMVEVCPNFKGAVIKNTKDLE